MVEPGSSEAHEEGYDDRCTQDREGRIIEEGECHGCQPRSQQTMEAELTMHHQQAPGIDSPMDEVGMTEHVNEM